MCVHARKFVDCNSVWFKLTISKLSFIQITYWRGNCYVCVQNQSKFTVFLWVNTKILNNVYNSWIAVIRQLEEPIYVSVHLSMRGIFSSPLQLLKKVGEHIRCQIAQDCPKWLKLFWEHSNHDKQEVRPNKKKFLFSVHPSQFFQVGRAFFFFFFAMRLILSLLYSGAPVCTYIWVIMKQRFHS